jgi:hypothetical protein
LFGKILKVLNIAFSFALMQKKQKIKDNPIASRVCPANATGVFAGARYMPG